MKTYKVWIEVEEYDDKTESGEIIDVLDYASVAEFDDLNAATRFANRLQKTGSMIAADYVENLVEP